MKLLIIKNNSFLFNKLLPVTEIKKILSDEIDVQFVNKVTCYCFSSEDFVEQFHKYFYMASIHSDEFYFHLRLKYGNGLKIVNESSNNGFKIIPSEHDIDDSLQLTNLSKVSEFNVN